MNNLIIYPKGYKLFLNYGSGWWITSDEESVDILQKIATIMTLKESPPDGLPCIIFSRDIKTIKDHCEETKIHSNSNTLNDNSEWRVFDYKHVRLWRRGDDPNILCEVIDEPGSLDDYLVIWYSIQEIYNQGLQLGAIPFHAGLAEYKGRGILLAAPGGGGKSTSCRRLPDGWKALCDDEALVVPDGNGTYRVHPFPTWSDYLLQRAQKTWDVQRSIPLSGIFFLEQSQNDETIPIAPSHATLHISHSINEVFKRMWICMRYVEKIKLGTQVFNNACKLAKMVPTFRLRISLHGKFWEEIEKSLDL